MLENATLGEMSDKNTDSMKENNNIKKYITGRELRQALGVSAPTVTLWKQQGCPHFCLGKSAGCGSRARFELDKVTTWLEERTKADKVQDTTTANQDTPMTDRADLMEQSRAAVARLEARQAAKNRKETK